MTFLTLRNLFPLATSTSMATLYRIREDNTELLLDGGFCFVTLSTG